MCRRRYTCRTDRIPNWTTSSMYLYSPWKRVLLYDCKTGGVDISDSLDQDTHTTNHTSYFDKAAQHHPTETPAWGILIDCRHIKQGNLCHMSNVRNIDHPCKVLSVQRSTDVPSITIQTTCIWIWKFCCLSLLSNRDDIGIGPQTKRNGNINRHKLCQSNSGWHWSNIDAWDTLKHDLEDSDKKLLGITSSSRRLGRITTSTSPSVSMSPIHAARALKTILLQWLQNRFGLPHDLELWVKKVLTNNLFDCFCISLPVAGGKLITSKIPLKSHTEMAPGSDIPFGAGNGSVYITKILLEPTGSMAPRIPFSNRKMPSTGSTIKTWSSGRYQHNGVCNGFPLYYTCFGINLNMNISEQISSWKKISTIVFSWRKSRFNLISDKDSLSRKSLCSSRMQIDSIHCIEHDMRDGGKRNMVHLLWNRLPRSRNPSDMSCGKSGSGNPKPLFGSSHTLSIIQSSNFDSSVKGDANCVLRRISESPPSTDRDLDRFLHDIENEWRGENPPEELIELHVKDWFFDSMLWIDNMDKTLFLFPTRVYTFVNVVLVENQLVLFWDNKGSGNSAFRSLEPIRMLEFAIEQMLLFVFIKRQVWLHSNEARMNRYRWCSVKIL